MEAKNLIREYLDKLQKLQMKAFDKRINMEITTRREENGNRPWLVAGMNMEGIDFITAPNEEQPYLILCVWDFLSEEGMREAFDKKLAIFENFIETH